jgi:hypothetical protein
MTRNRKWLLASIAVLGLIAASCAGGGGAESGSDDGESSTNTYSDNDVTFEYPGDWDEFEADAAAVSSGSNELWTTTVGPDETNLVNVTAYQLAIDVSESNIGDIEAELNGVIQGVVDQAGGTIDTGPNQTTISDFPAYTYEWSGVEVDGQTKDSRAVFLFDGDVEYFFNCQFDSETENDIEAGCDLMLDTFESTASG